MNLDCYEPCPVSSTRLTRARKDAICAACREPIIYGSKYYREAFLCDGTWTVTKRCVRCERIYQHLCTLASFAEGEAPDSSLSCGHLYEEVHGGPPPAEVAELAFALPSDFVEDTEKARKARS